MTYNTGDKVYVSFFDGTFSVIIDFSYIDVSVRGVTTKYYSGTLNDGSERAFPESQIRLSVPEDLT